MTVQNIKHLGKDRQKTAPDNKDTLSSFYFDDDIQ